MLQVTLFLQEWFVNIPRESQKQRSKHLLGWRVILACAGGYFSTYVEPHGAALQTPGAPNSDLQ